MVLDLEDKTTNNNDLINLNSASESADTPFAQSTASALLVPASFQYFEASDSASLSITGDLTFEAWVKFTSTPASDTGQEILAKYGTSTNRRSFHWYFYNNGGTPQLYFGISSDGTAGNFTQGGVNITWDTSWHHWAVVYDASAGSAEMFKDGVSLGTVSSLKTSIYDSNASLTIGVLDEFSPSFYLDGRIDDVRIWNVTRTSTQIDDNKSIELVVTESGLVAYYPFDALTSSSPSITQSFSISLSPSVSLSASPSISPSPSSSLSLSPSASLSPSPIENTLSVDLVCLKFIIQYADKYSLQSTSFLDKHSQQNTSYSNKYAVKNTTYADKYSSENDEC